jgi:pimeloyl-ACP methyl ester carboxylesterase
LVTAGSAREKPMPPTVIGATNSAYPAAGAATRPNHPIPMALGRPDRVRTWPEPNLQASELAKVAQRSLVMFSDDDLVTLTHAVDMYDALPNAELAVVPGTSHFLTQEKPHLVNAIVLDFLTNEPVPTIAAIRRAPAATQ